MKSTVAIYIPGGLVDPLSNNTTKPKWARVLEYIKALKSIIGGGIADRVLNGSYSRPTIVAGTDYAKATVTCAAVVNANTLTLNGQALTATQHNSTGTFTLVSAIATDTVTINGVVFTGTAGAVVAGAPTFSIDTGDTQAATSLAAQVNAYAPFAGVLTAVSAAGVVTIRAYVAGVAGDLITITSQDSTITASGAVLSGGAAIANNQFDFTGSAAEECSSLVAAINASTTAIVANHVKASNLAGSVVAASAVAGDWVEIAGVRLTAVAAASPGTNNTWTIITSDTAAAAALVVTINAHPVLKELVFASSSTGTVTVRQLPFGTGVGTKLVMASNNGTRLAVTQFAATGTAIVCASKKGTGANAVTIASSGATLAIGGSVSRLAGGTDTTLTF